MRDYQKSQAFVNEKARVERQLVAAGVPQDQAQTVADCFATADVFGVTSHGESVLPAHLQRLAAGKYNLSPNFRVLRETAAFAVIDGDNALGPVSAANCLAYAAEKVQKSGVFTVFSPNNNTFGPAFYYGLQGARQGLITMVMSNSPAQMALCGGAEKMLGTNPFSVVVPTGKGDPIIVDMATSVVAKSKFKEYAAAGKPLPQGWALDENGLPTTDPQKAMAGFVLPMAGFKGYGIALLIDLVAGFLSGAGYLNHVGRFYSEETACMNVGFCLQLMDPEMIFGKSYNEMIEDYVSQMRNSKARPGETIVLPGDDRMRRLTEQMKGDER